jgi:predicted 2-oxoglutarate/Fe(II)-dependent dioxygenase YbiX
MKSTSKPLVKQSSPTEESIGVDHIARKGLHFADALELGFVIDRYNKNQGNTNYSVHVRKGNQIKTFPNVTATNLALELDIPVTKLVNEWQIGSDEHHQTFEQRKI